MAFNFQWLTRVNQTISPFKGQNPAEGQATGGPTLWVYNATSTGSNDSTTTVEASNYFLGASGFLGVGDWIFVDTNNSGYLILSVTAVTAGTTVTTQTFTAGSSGVTFSGSLVSGDFPKWSGTTGLVVDSGVAVANLMQLNVTNTMAAGSQIIFDKGTVTQATSGTTAVTLNKQAGLITTVSLTTAAGSTVTFTLNNSEILAGSQILVSLAGGTNTTNYVNLIGQVTGAGTATISFTNTASVTALNGTLVIQFLVL